MKKKDERAKPKAAFEGDGGFNANFSLRCTAQPKHMELASDEGASREMPTTQNEYREDK